MSRVNRLFVALALLQLSAAFQLSATRHPLPTALRRGPLVLQEEAPAAAAEDTAPVEEAAAPPSVPAPDTAAGVQIPTFDFGGSSQPASERGANGLNEQGFEPYDKAAAETTTDSTWIKFLGVFAAATVVLSTSNGNPMSS